MQIKVSQLPAHLKKQGLGQIYVIIGDEPLQVQECGDLIRKQAKYQGFSEREVLSVEKGFNWQSVEQQAQSLSLFASRRLLELRLADKSPGTEGAKALISYLQNPAPATILLITIDKLETAQQKAKWFLALDKAALIIQVRPISLLELPNWIAQRFSQLGLQASPEAIAVLAQRSEGHTLACAQEIEKLFLLYGKGRIDANQVMEVVADSARFETFAWVDTVLSGDVVRGTRQLKILKAEGYEVILIVWALTREIRNLCQMSAALQAGQRWDQVSKTFQVWQFRKPILEKALKRHRYARWKFFLKQSARLDSLVKGAERGDVWEELSGLGLQIAGIDFQTTLDERIMG